MTKKKGAPTIYDVAQANPFYKQIDAAQKAAAKKKAELEAKKKAAEEAKKKGKPPKVDTSNNGTGSNPPTQPDANYKWNLPPHRWSLPIKPETMNKELNNALGDLEKYRRGRMWWYVSNQQDFFDKKGKVTKKLDERKFGFQFLWNPDNYTTSIQLNTDVNPSPLDRFVGVAGAFPSGESISFTLRLDRTNDFAAFRGLISKDYNNLALSNTTPIANFSARMAAQDQQYLAQGAQTKNVYNSGAGPEAYESALEYYSTGFATNLTKEQKLIQIKELMELGTVADIEYLYKAINGDNWHNIAGRKTSDIGFLAATLLRLDIGPLSYVGYVNSLNINHIAFSQDMTPIRTDVTVQMNLMASAGLGQIQDGQNGPTQ